MKTLISLILILLSTVAFAQDTTHYYWGWGKPGYSSYQSKQMMKDSSYTEVKFQEGRPVLIKQYDDAHTLHSIVRNSYDERGNHLTRRSYYPNGQLAEEMVFQNDPEEMALFQKIFGATFIPGNSNFLIRREYNYYGRETGYYIVGVRGETICSRITTYRDDRRKDRELLRDDLKKVVLADRRYKYFDEEERTVLEEFNGAGKLVQRVVLFDHNEIIQE